MIKSFKNKALAELYSKGRSSKIDAKLQKRILIRLRSLEIAGAVAELNMPGYDFHALNGFKPPRYTIHINGPWCITFEFEGGDAYKVDLEQYH